MLHGVLLITLFSLAAFYIGDFKWVKSLSFSPMIVGIILGMLYANSLRNNLPETWVPGIKFCSKRILRIGIILYGFRLTFQDVTAVGLSAIIVDAIIVVVTICGGILIGRLLKMDRGIALLTSVGSGICGAAAVLGAESAIRTKPYKTAVAVSTVVIFGTLSMFLYPVLYRTGMLSALSERGIGIYIGATLHEVAHVVGAGEAMGGELASTATITKMIRVILLAPMLLGLSYWVRPRGQVSKNAPTQGKIQVPWFAFYFVGVVLLHSVLFRLSAGQGWSEIYQRITETIQWLDNLALTMAMMAIGLDATFAKFKQSGVKPFLLALGLYVWLVIGGYALTYLLV